MSENASFNLINKAEGSSFIYFLTGYVVWYVTGNICKIDTKLLNFENIIPQIKYSPLFFVYKLVRAIFLF